MHGAEMHVEEFVRIKDPGRHSFVPIQSGFTIPEPAGCWWACPWARSLGLGDSKIVHKAEPFVRENSFCVTQTAVIPPDFTAVSGFHHSGFIPLVWTGFRCSHRTMVLCLPSCCEG